MLSSASQMDINNIPTPDNMNPDTLSNLHDMKDQFLNFQQTLTNSLSDIPGVSKMIATQDNVGNSLPDYNELLSEIGLTPEDMKKYTEKLIRGGGCGIGDYACQDKVKRAKVTAEYTESKLAFNKAKDIKNEKQKEFELVEYGGASGVKNHNFTKAEREGEKIKEKKIENHNHMKNKIQNNLDLLMDQNIYDSHMDNFSDMLNTSAIGVQVTVDDMVNKSNVDSRKVYYEDQNTQIYVWLNSYLKYLYWLLLVILLIVELYTWYKGKMTFSPYVALGYSFFMLLYPFLMNTIVNGVIYILKNIYGNVPRDVYMDL